MLKAITTIIWIDDTQASSKSGWEALVLLNGNIREKAKQVPSHKNRYK